MVLVVLVLWKASVTSNEEEWQAYVGTEFRDITGPAHLLQWWEARPASPCPFSRLHGDGDWLCGAVFFVLQIY